MTDRCDAVVVGGGFYGVTIARYLRASRHLRRVVLLERDPRIMGRSSFNNQARVHAGYHYLRSYTTAFRSRQNMPRFLTDYAAAVRSDFTMLYAIGRQNSKLTRVQMERFCREVGAPLTRAPAALKALFNPSLIEEVYVAEEFAFDADILRRIAMDDLRSTGVELHLGAEVEAVIPADDGVIVRGAGPDGPFEWLTPMVFNCSYSRLQAVAGAAAPSFGLRHEIAEMVLIDPPAWLTSLAVTVMDGPFFSTVPFPARGLYTLSHVRYTPHQSWIEDGAGDPYARLAAYDKASRGDRMLRDAARYMPRLAEAEIRDSLFEVKTVLTRNDGDDGRPILMHRHGAGGRVFSILGGKVDNVYDILERLDAETLPAHAEG